MRLMKRLDLFMKYSSSYMEVVSAFEVCAHFIANLCRRCIFHKQFRAFRMPGWYLILNLVLFISGSVCALHYSQCSSVLHRMRIPAIHDIVSAAQLSHFLHALHELLCSKLLQEKVAWDEKSRLNDANNWILKYVRSFAIAMICLNINSYERIWNCNSQQKLSCRLVREFVPNCSWNFWS